MLYLITGGAGFIGSSLAEALLGKGNSVRILDNFSSGKRANLDFTSTPEMEVIEGDILHSWADISLARKYLDFEPAVSFRDALLQTTSWYQRKNY
jgi:nucleoside-diphosphate-sugar epimerase